MPSSSEMGRFVNTNSGESGSVGISGSCGRFIPGKGAQIQSDMREI